MDMTPTDKRAERAAEFERLLAAIPAEKNVDRIRKVCEILHCEENTVRVWRLRTGTKRVIPAAKLAILKDSLGRMGVKVESLPV